MRPAIRLTVGLLAVLAVSAAPQDEKNVPLTLATPNAAIDKAVFDSLREVINRGAAVYNKNDHGGCYRIFEGGLIAVRPLLAHRPELQKEIGEAFEAVEADPLTWRRAFTLRRVLDKIRREVNPDKKADDKGKVEVKDKPKDGADKDRQKKEEDDRKAKEATEKKAKDDADKKKEEDDKKKKEDEDKKATEADKKKVEEELPPPLVEKVPD